MINDMLLKSFEIIYYVYPAPNNLGFKISKIKFLKIAVFIIF